MRYKLNEFAPSNKRQYWFAVGVRDLKILKGLAIRSLENMPHLPDDPDMRDVQSRLRSMAKSLDEAIQEAEELGDDGERRKPIQPENTFTAEAIINDELSENEA